MLLWASRGWCVAAVVVGLLLGPLADAQAQTSDAFNPDPDGSVYAIAAQPDGRILIGGQFSSLHDGAVTRVKIARLNPDGSVDATFDPGTTIAPGDVRAIVVQPDQKILIAGVDTAGGRHIARLNTNGSLDPSFDAVANGPVYAVALQPDGKIVVGGAFTTLAGGGIGPAQRRGIGRLDANGSVDTSFNPGTDGTVRALALDVDGRLLVGGTFTTLGGGDTGTTTRHNIGRLLADGSLDVAFDPGAGSHPFPRVTAFAIQPDGKILVGGRFMSLGGGGTGTAPRNNLGRLQANGSLDATFVPALKPPDLCDCATASVERIVVLPNRKILVGGHSVVLTDDGATSHHLVRLEPDGWVDPGFEDAGDATVRALTQQFDGLILAGGDFEWEDEIGSRRYLVRLHVFTLAPRRKLVPFGAAGLPSFGDSVALSSSGDIALVGGSGDDGGVGAAWVWVREHRFVDGQNQTGWFADYRLLASNGIGPAVNLGASVALSGNGNTAIVGGPGDHNSTGAAWIWIRNGTEWVQQAKLVAPDATGAALQGSSVAISADGNTAIVGARGDNGVGGAFVWTRTGNTWARQGTKLLGSDAVGGAQGNAVALAGNGNTAIVGSSTDASSTGAAWIFTRSGGVWSQQGSKLVGVTDSPTGNQGSSVALSTDGNTALVGGTGDGNGTGAAWVWVRNVGAWSQQGPKLVGYGSVGASVHQGSSVALSGSGDMAIVGGSGDASSRGAAWAWTRTSGVWTQRGPKMVSPNHVGAAQQGKAVAISTSNGIIAIGGNGDGEAGGAAWVSTTPPVLSVTTEGADFFKQVWRLHAVVNGSPTTVTFDYGPTTSYGRSVWKMGPQVPFVNAEITGLTCDTVYHFRAVAADENMALYGSDRTFSTNHCPPTVETLPATNISATGATLNVMVNPNGAETDLDFRYGPTTSYDRLVTLGVVGSGRTAVPRSLDVTSLMCGTTYHYLARAGNYSGVTVGADRTFTTRSCTPGGPDPFTDEPLLPGATPLRAVHILELRTRIDSLRQRFGVSPTAWTDPSLTGVRARVVHVQQLRDALLGAYDAAIQQGVNAERPVFADSPLTPAASPIRVLHIEQLRAAVLSLESSN